jgi:hypothetical protein
MIITHSKLTGSVEYQVKYTVKAVNNVFAVLDAKPAYYHHFNDVGFFYRLISNAWPTVVDFEERQIVLWVHSDKQ